MRQFLRDTKIALKLNFILGAIIFLIILSLGGFISLKQKQKILHDSDQRMAEQVEDLSLLIQQEVKANQ